MISSIKGSIINKGKSGVTVDVQGVGFLVFLPANELPKLAVGQEVFLHTYLSVKEDALDLYGSLEKGVIDWFRLLLNVKGIGPKSSLAVMSIVKPKDLSAAIQTGKSDILIALGVGKKTAERIVLELKTKALELSAASGPVDHPALALESEALSALESLGYSRDQAREALRGIEGGDVGSKVRGALRILGRR
ncbi:MAG: Holliday junction DNA helicase RuvA [Candidatus Komeilibacteria bacterium RIFCSPLOWO2_02_FULL_48_11]|uniref:Holliday junction branch migration complex subunit RuvA n=1 Tax=Candidatus Komeilibacteria bacterium RIFCSPLOWO2_02_FULL_48_11 TaxID=1798553 RepID=A0A1G2BV83_9BACT|nr:MAG: Holliday junction DNA helicase RuvA [Candidatus Komeilibacteria bacterium RIFCSPLOWO2_02_FULL_48_11]